MKTRLPYPSFFSFLILTAFLLAAFGASSQIIGWDASTVPGGTYGPSPWTPSTLNVRLTSTGLIRGANIGTDTSVIPANLCWGGQEGWSTAASDATSFYFTFQATTGYKINLSTISSATRRSNTGPTGCSVWYSLNGGAYIKIADWSTSVTTGTTGTANSASLTGIAALQNIPAGTAVKFRLSPNGTTGNYYITGGTNCLKIDGTVVPAAVITTQMNGTAPICIGDSANINVAITGGASPYKLIYSDGSAQTTINNYVSGTPISVTPSTTTAYTVVSVTDANGTVSVPNSGSATITVNPLPVVAASNIVTCAVGEYTFTSGTPAGGTYSIPNPYSGPSTTYTYSYTNANNCSKTSATYTFTRNTPVAINTQPSTATQTTCLNGSFNPITVAATGSGTITYQWYSNATASTTGGTALITAPHLANGSRTASFTPLATALGTTYYYVTVTNSCGTIKSTATTGVFTVEAQAVAGTITQNQTICAGTSPNDLTLSGNSRSVVKWQMATDAGFTSGVQDIAVTNVVLQGSAVGNLLQTTYIRAIVSNGSCPAVPTTPIEIKIKTTTWNGSWDNGLPDSVTTVVFASDYNSTSDLQACAVVVNSGNIVINSNHTLTVQNALKVNGGSVVFENNSSLIQVNDAANSGNITYKRNAMPMVGFDFTYWSSPVNFQILATFSPDTRFDKYFWWNTSTYSWNAVTAPGITPMEVGKGYIMRAPAAYNSTPQVFEGKFIGTPNNGNYTVPIGVTNAAKNFNLLGNPYPSAISADAFMSAPENAAALGTGSTIYLWTHNTGISYQAYNTSDYASYNYTGGTGTAPASGPNTNRPNGFIAAGQSFMINGLANGTATFKNSMRSGSNNQFFKNAGNGIEKNRLWLALKNATGVYKETLVGYIQNATNGIDRGFDGENIPSGNGYDFYSVANDAKLSIQGRALPFHDSDVLQLGFTASAAGSFEIGLVDYDGLFGSQDVYLEDQLLHTIHNLKQGDYTFTTVAGAFDSRFMLRFTDSQLGTDNPLDANNQVVVYQKNSEVIIHSDRENLSEVLLFDISGRLIRTETALHTKEISIDAGNTTAVMIIKVVLKNGQASIHKIIN